MQGLQNFTFKKWLPDPQGYDEIFQIWLTVMSMLEARGYIIPDTSRQLKWTDYISQYSTHLQYFIQMYESRRLMGEENKSFRQLLVDQYEHKDGGKCYVRFISPSGGIHISNEQFRSLASITNLDVTYREVFVISSHPLAHKVVELLGSKQFSNYKFMMDTDVLIDPEEFHLHNLHEKLSDKESKEFCRDNDIAMSKLPQITKDDVIVVKHGWIPGDLIRITRINYFTNGTVSQSIYYRVVSHGESRKK